MTDMKRTTVSFPEELTARIFALRKDDRFMRCSYSELIRQLAEKGLSLLEEEKIAQADKAALENGEISLNALREKHRLPAIKDGSAEHCSANIV